MLRISLAVLAVALAAGSAAALSWPAPLKAGATMTTRPAAPAADVALRLDGVIVAGPESAALIARGGGTAQSYGIGAALAPNVTVSAIAFDHVDLTTDGRAVRLTLPLPRASARPTLAQRIGDGEARDALARVAYAEAGNQGDDGLAAVVYTIINRLADGRWGESVGEVVNAPRQFEPVLRAGGDWRRLPAVSEAKQARIDTIVNLALGGRLPDLTGGARYFQNPAVVAARARQGQVSPRLVDFGGAAPSAVIGAHSFYADVR